MDHHYHHNQPPPRGGRQVTSKDVAQANDYFEHFLNATSLKNILGYYRSICDLLNLKPNLFPHFYPKLRGHLTSWRAKALWKKFDARAGHKCYGKGKLCSNSRVLIIGAGPCGLRTAIEAQLLGAKVVVIEKRDRLSRNNVLHLWPFVIEDLRSLGAKKFFGKFCAGAIDHISIRQLQCILLKVVLLLGVEVHTEVSFERLVEPDSVEKTGWRAEFEPSTHPVSQYEFDVVIGADGKRNTLQGFKRKEFRGKLAIAITANFINKRTEAEARVEEISGVAFIFNQKFFKDLYEDTGIDLENIVYYKDDTHYFVMTAKKPSLIEKGVIKQDLADTERLLAPDNVNREALMDYAREAANFSTNYQMPDVEFAVNHYGQPDVAMFDFTSMYAAENASKVVERSGYRLLMILVGDSLLEPFWPTGSGCARGFLSSLDAAWAIRSWCSGTMNPLDVIAERESIYRLLGQTTPDNLNKDWKAYTLDPVTRYPNLNKNVVMPHQTSGLFDTDNPKSIERMRRHSLDTVEVPKKRRRGNVDNEVLLNWISEQVRGHEDIVITDLASVFRDGKVLCAILNRYRPDLLDYNAVKDEEPAKKNQMAIDVLEKEIGISPIMTGEEITNAEDYLAMATYLTQIYDNFRCEIPHIKHPKLELPEGKRSDASFKSVKHYNQQQQQIIQPTTQAAPPRPSSRHKRHADALIVSKPSPMERKPRKRRTLEKIGASVDHENKLPNQTRGNADEDFAARIKSLEDKWKEPQPVEKKPKDLLRAIGKIETSDWNIKEIEKKIRENKLGKPGGKDKEKVPKWSKEQFIARQTKMEKQHLEKQDSAEAKYADIDKNIKHLELKLKEGNARDLGQNKVATITEKLASKVPDNEPKPIQKSQSRPVILPSQNASEFCHFCGKRVYLMERLSAEGRFFHHGCFKCQYCNTQLRLGSYAFDRDGMYDHKFFCIHHYGMQGEVRATKVTRKPSQRQPGKSPEKKPLGGIAGVDLLDRVRTPERVEFSNLSVANASSEHEESLSQMDEDEWTDKNFGASAAELGSSEDESSSLSDSDSDDEDAFEEALEEPATKEGTLKWAERFNRRYSKKRDDSESDDYSSSDQSSYYENTTDDEDSDTATEGEEEIRARELRKQEVRVEPPVVQTDTGTDTEVTSSNLPIPDILSDNLLRVPKSDSKQTCSEDDSADFSSAISGDHDSDDNSPKTDNSQSNFSLAKSATAGALLPPKPPKNFVLPFKEKRKSFGAEFVPKFNATESEPLLIIKRTPSKLNLPKEIGKPKVAIGSNIEKAKKYFGTPAPKKPPVAPKPVLKRSGTVANVLKNRLIKQNSLPDKPKEDTNKTTFNFEPLEDSKEIDTYIESLLAHEEELMKPIDPDKYKIQPEPELQAEESEEEKISSSIEDLFKALKTETRPEGDSSINRNIDEKVEDLLNWMDDLEHQSNERKTYRSLSDAKYKNLERHLKVPKRAKSVVSKIPQDNIEYFERHLAGKSVEEDAPPKSFALARSKTDIYCNKSRNSVDLNAVSNVDFKKVLMKFERAGSQESEPKPEKLPQKRSFGKRFSLGHFQKKEEQRRNSANFEDALKAFEDFVDTFEEKKGLEQKDWCVNITVSTIPNPEFLGLDNFGAQNENGDATGTKAEERDLSNSNNEEVTPIGPQNLDEVESEVGGILGKTESVESNNSNGIEHKVEGADFKKSNEAEEAKIDTQILPIENEVEGQIEKIDFNKEIEEVQSEPPNCTTNNEETEKAELKEQNDVAEAIESSEESDDSEDDSESEEESSSESEESESGDSSKATHGNEEVSSVEPLKPIQPLVVVNTETATPQRINVEDLYAKVNKSPKVKSNSPPIVKSNSPPPPPVPQRTHRKSLEEQVPLPPPRPQRQKSTETPKSYLEQNNNEEMLPVPPQRKRAMTSSPLPQRKSTLLSPDSVDNAKSRSTTNLEVKKEIVRLKDLPRVQNAARARTGDLKSKNRYKDKDKDCSLQ